MHPIDDTPVLAQLVHENVHIMIWRAPIDGPTLDRTKAVGLDLAKKQTEAAANPWGAQRETVELDELRLNQLRALGYVVR